MTKTEVKVQSATWSSFGLGLVVAALNAFQADANDLLGGVPPVLQSIIIAIVPPVVTWLGGFLMPSKTSRVSEAFVSGESNRAA
jgi:hypothetical protein